MSKYNDDYYIAIESYCERFISVKAQKQSAGRRFLSTKLLPGEPLFFENSNKAEDIADGVKNMLSDVFFSSTLIVEKKLREEFKQLKTHGMQLYPAIFVDDEDNWHENYWCMNFYQFIDCIDREKTVFDDDTLEDLAEDPSCNYLTVDRYSLSEAVLDEIPEDKRLFFKTGVDFDAKIFVHKKAVDVFEKHNATGIRFIKVADFESGDEYT